MTYYRIIDPQEVGAEALQRMIATLPQWRREEALRFRHENGRRECTLSYLLLCEMLREYFGITEQPRFVIGEHGKPEIAMEDEGGKDMNIHINISHCKRAIACAVSNDGEVGIDVECLGRHTPQLAEYCMSEEELRQINGAEDPDLVFTMLWTKKEALLKFTGEGITDDMKNCLTSHRIKGVTIESTSDKEKGYAVSIATKSKVSSQRS